MLGFGTGVSGLSSGARGSLPDVGIMASRLLRAFQRELFAELALVGHAEIRPRHGAVLAFIDAAGTRAVDLSARSGAHKQVITTLVDELEALGYVVRESDPTDRRAKLVVPTELGLDQMTKARQIHRRIEDRYAAALGTEAFAAFKESFDALTRLATQGDPG